MVVGLPEKDEDFFMEKEADASFLVGEPRDDDGNALRFGEASEEEGRSKSRSDCDDTLANELERAWRPCRGALQAVEDGATMGRVLTG